MNQNCQENGQYISGKLLKFVVRVFPDSKFSIGLFTIPVVSNAVSSGRF